MADARKAATSVGGNEIPRMADALDEARARTFVGRDAELAALLGLIETGGHAHVHGPAGIGKTELLRALQRRLSGADRRILSIDAREISSPRRIARGAILLIDGVEPLTPAACQLAALRSRLPRRAAIISAGRGRLPGVPLSIECGVLSHSDSLGYLERAGVPEARRNAIARACGGHPLALTLYARAPYEGAEEPSIRHDPDLVYLLTSRLLHDLPGPRERTVLRAAALALRVRRDLVAHLEPGRSGALFTWLSRLPFVERERGHLILHDLVREAVVADLQWRDPSELVRLRRRLARYYLSFTASETRAPTLAERVHLAASAAELSSAPTEDEVRAALERLVSEDRDDVASLDRDTIAREVKRALRHLDRVDLLCQSPLTRCRVVVASARDGSIEARAERLQALLVESCQAVRDVHGNARGFDVLERTYIRPAPKQLAAAHDLGLSFATYRRALVEATDQLVARVWALERERGSM